MEAKLNFNEIKAQILESDDFVLSETKKIQYGYTLKQVTRYAIDRHEEVQSESVAEHVFALHLVADYFLPLEDAERELDWIKIHNMLQYHDIDEIETGDTVGYLKTDSERAIEGEAAERVIQGFPGHLKPMLQSLIPEYEAQQTPEAKFAKALDRIEPMFHLYSTRGKAVMQWLKTTREQNDSLKQHILKPYKCMYRFYEVLTEHMEKEGYFNKQ